MLTPRPPNAPHTLPVRGRRAFTLIELLVTLVVIALLLALTLPALAQARQMLDTLRCQSRQRQLTTATIAYQKDHRQRYPQPIEDYDLAPDRAGRALWFNALDAYLELPSKRYRAGASARRNYAPIKQDPVWSRFSPARQQVNRTLKMNEHFGEPASADELPGQGYRFHTAGDVPDPAQTVLFVDGRANDIAPRDTFMRRRFGATEGLVAPRHGDGANVAFVDGHVDHVTQPINDALAAPGWYVEGTGRQELIWDFTE